jgi:hypothetical protein
MDRTTKSRGPTEQVRATIARLSRLVERHAAGEYARAKALPKESPFGRSQTLKSDRLRMRAGSRSQSSSHRKFFL